MSKVNHIPALGFDSLTGFYDRVIAHTMPEKQFRDALINHAFTQHPAAEVLEFGAGTASNSILAKTKFPALKVTGIDVDEKVLALAQKKIDDAGLDIDMVQYDGKNLPFEANSFDRVISSLVFHHLKPKGKQQAFNEIHRVLKPGGQLVFADWGKPANFANSFTFFLLRIFDGWENTAGHADRSYLTMLEKAGFDKPIIAQQFNTIYGTLEMVNTNRI